MDNKLNHSRRSFLKNMGIMASGSCISNNLIATPLKNDTPKNYLLNQFGFSEEDDDITNPLSRALNQLEQTGGKLQLPAGAFKVSQPITIEVTKDIQISGKNTRLIFDKVSGYCLSFIGVKTNNLSKQDYQLFGNILTLKKNQYHRSFNLILRENNYLFQDITLNFKKINTYTFGLTSEETFFTPAMQGQNLITSQNPGLTFYIIKFIDSYNVLVIPGNNQDQNLDLSSFNQWTVANLWSKSRGYYIKGEILAVEKEMKYQLQDTYISLNSSCDSFYSGKLTLNDFAISSLNSKCKYGLKLINLDSAVLNNLQVTQFLNNSINIAESINIVIKSCNINSSISGLASNYACLIESSQKITIGNSTIAGGFHGLSHGGTFPCRDLQIVNTQTLQTGNWGLDFHGNCANIKIDKVYCANGAYIGGINCLITRSSFSTNDEKRAALVIGPERNSTYYSIDTCKIANSVGNAIAITSQFSIDSIKSITINSSQITAGQNGIILQSYPYGANPTLENLDVNNNSWKVAKEKQKTINNHTIFKVPK